jgi:hypothetical protein
MKTIASVLMCSALAFSGGAAVAKDATQLPAAKPLVAKEAPAAKPMATRRAVAMSDAELSQVVAGTNPAAGIGIGTALLGTPSASTPNLGVVNAVNGIAYHALANAHTCPGLGQITAAC